MRRGILITALILAAACSPESPDSNADGTWVGTITTEGNVTTVVNESGSVWGGAASLVEEVSIGVESGDERMMFGDVEGVAVYEREVFVVDASVPAVRVFSIDGVYRRDIGGPGSGPGEYRFPDSVKVSPRGDVFIRDGNLKRISVFSGAGDLVATYPLSGTFSSSREIVVTPDGEVHNPWRFDRLAESFSYSTGMMRYGRAGPVGDPLVPLRLDFAPTVLATSQRERVRPVPYAPNYVWAMTPGGAFVAGVSDRYRFVVAQEDRELRVERFWDPVPVQPAEGEYVRRWVTASMRRYEPEWSWSGAPVPPNKPSFAEFIPAQTGEIWVRRFGDGERQSRRSCKTEPGTQGGGTLPCWREKWIIDAFDTDGRFLGRVVLPEEIRLHYNSYLSLYRPVVEIYGDSVWAATEDEAGTIMVKRYRLVLPGEEGQ